MTTPAASVGRTLEAPPVGHPLLVGADAGSAEFAAVVALAGTHAVQSVPVLADVKSLYDRHQAAAAGFGVFRL